MATAKDKAKDEPAPEPAAPEGLPPFHGLEPAWVREALIGILERLAKLEK